MQKFSMYRGDTKHLIITITEKDGSLVSLEGANAVWTMGDVTKTLGDGIQITGEGKVTVYLNPIDTEGKSGSYRHVLVITDVHGNVSTVLRDMIEIKSR